MNIIPRGLVVVFVVLILATLGGGVWSYRSQRERFRQQAEQELETITRLKTDQIVRWRAERLGDASVLMESPFFGEAVSRWMTDTQAGNSEQLLRRFRSMQTHYHYRDVLLVDAEGKVRLSLSGRLGPLHEEAVQALATAFRSRRAVFSDLHVSTADLAPHLGVIAPFFAGDRPASAPLGAVVLLCDAREFLYPLIQSWPVPSSTGEAALVRRDGGTVLFLSELRHQRDTVLKLRVPLTQTDVPAVMAVLGKEGVVQGTDYRGVQVLAVLEAVADSPWFLVVKMDQEEIFASLRQQAWMIAIIAALLIVGVALVFGLAWQQQSARSLRRDLSAERERKALVERIAYLTKHANDIILFTDHDWRIVEANDRAVAAYGYSHDELQRLTLHDLRTPEGRKAFDREAKQVDAQNGMVVEAVHQRKDGSAFPVESSMRTVEFEGKHFHQAIIRDITERKRAEAELVATKRRYQELFDNVIVGLLRTTPGLEGAFIDVNPAMVEMFEADSREQLMAVHPSEIYLDPSQRRIVSDALMSQGSIKGQEITFKTLKGRPIWCRISAVKKTDVNGQVYFDNTIEDITERKRAEEALRNSESMLNEMGRIAEVGGWEMDLITRQARWTKGTYDIVEIGYDDPVPGPDEHVSYYLPEYRPIVEGAMKRLIEDDIALEFEAKLRTTKGNIKWCRALGKAVRKDGVCIRVYGTFQNITERKRAEEEIRELNRTLEQRVRDRTAELEAANKELETFSYSVSHDLRAPLRSIDGFSRILLEKCSAKLDDEGKEHLGRVRAASQRMGELIDDLLILSRATRADLRRTAVDLTALAGEIAEELQRTEPERRVRWVVAPGLAANGDPQLLRATLENLLGNSWKFTGKRTDAVIEFGAVNGDTGHAFFVRDNGVGFDMAYAGKLFGAFQRLHATADFPGTGIGLATVQRIIHRHGGRVWAEGEVNHGATFFFTLEGSTVQGLKTHEP